MIILLASGPRTSSLSDVVRCERCVITGQKQARNRSETGQKQVRNGLETGQILAK